MSCYYRIVVMYDNDKTGIKQAQKLKESYGYPNIQIPETINGEKCKDIADFFALGGTPDDFDKLVQEQLIASGYKEKIILRDINLTPQKVTETPKPVESVPVVKEEVPVIQQEERKVVRTAKQRLADASSQEKIKPLFDVFFQKNELAILFGDTGKGKSIAAVSIANAISKGESFLGLRNENEPQVTLYYDFELSDKQFEKRYSNDAGVPYKFSGNFYIDNIDFSDIVPTNKSEKFENKLMDRIKRDIKETGAKVVVIDNITYLSTQSAEDGQVALNLMKLLKDLKSQSDISVLALAHTPKKSNPLGITIQDLAGSKHVSNFADSVFAIGSSNTEKNIRYFKQVKPSRSAEWVYDQNNVLVCEIQKVDNFLTFIPQGTDQEQSLLKKVSSSDDESLADKAMAMKNEGITYRDIAKELKVSKSTIGRWLKENE